MPVKKKSNKLNPAQRRFIQEYLKDQNATQAYLRVYGGSIKAAEANSSRLISNDKVGVAIERGLARLADRANITAERNIKRIAEIAYHDKGAKRVEILKACELIGKTFGQFKDVVESKSEVAVTVVDEEQVRKTREKIQSDC